MHDDADNDWGLARREFLKATGAAVVALGVGGQAPAQTGPTAAPAMQRGVTSGPPDEAEVDSFIAVNPDNTVTIYAGYVEIGQGGPTALRQIAAEELDLDFDQVLTVRNDTFVCTNGLTAASMTVAIGGTKLRAAASEARRVLLTLAGERLNTPIQDLVVAKGVVSVRNAPQRTVSYGDLLGGKPFNHRYEPVTYRGVGIEVPRTNPNNAPPRIVRTTRSWGGGCRVSISPTK